IELQRDNRGADPRRARFHSSMLDTWSLKNREPFSKLREAWIIFITEKDALKLGLPVYTIDRRINETGGYFGDGSHIVYVNGALKDEATPIGKLMHDFFCTKPDDMNYKLLADRTRYFKEDPKGVRKMSNIMNKIRLEGKAEGRAEGRAEGLIEGRVKMLFDLVSKKLLSVSDAAMSINISESEFLAKMNAAK
ncbi:MAG: hypothetical protein IJG62_02610, partial [Synergistaceae bacterium]|nr:hypothetical protein [Synergistaceae bacterium]